MILFIIFILGIGNFTLHQAMMESRHPVFMQMPFWMSGTGRKLALIIEFTFLLVSLAFAANAVGAAIWTYGLYSLLNGLSCWMIVTRRI